MGDSSGSGGDNFPTLGELSNVDPTFDGTDDSMYAFRIQNGKLYPVAAKDFMSENKMALVPQNLSTTTQKLSIDS